MKNGSANGLSNVFEAFGNNTKAEEIEKVLLEIGIDPKELDEEVESRIKAMNEGENPRKKTGKTMEFKPLQESIDPAKKPEKKIEFNPFFMAAGTKKNSRKRSPGKS